MAEDEIQRIVNSANFLIDLGYVRKIEDASIYFLNNEINIIITYERYSDTSDILIKFLKENEMFSVGWIACVRSGLDVKPHQRLENVLVLLLYIRDNYSLITDRAYCKESDKLVREFIDRRRAR